MPKPDDTPLVRTFVALSVSDEARRNLALFEEQARRLRVRVGWVKPVNLHVTMAFLGLVPAADLPALGGRLDQAAARFAPFDFDTAGIRWFGGRRPRVIWAGVPEGEGAQAITRIAAAVREAVRECGYPDDERDTFTPHVTVGRLRPGAEARDLMDFLERRYPATPFGRTSATGITLMRSELGRDGTVYTPIHESPFTGIGGPAGCPPPGP